MTMCPGPGMICLGTHKYAARLISNCTLQGREDRRGARGSRAYRGDIMNTKGGGGRRSGTIYVHTQVEITV